ncbi:MAG: hypothetical protein ACLP50_37595 [Solirubrobacteraceae bacterium]
MATSTTRAGATLTAIFGSLPAGAYVVWAGSATPGPTIAVTGGIVTELALS